MPESVWSRLASAWAEITDLERVAAVLDWDQQVYMPAAGAAGRGEQLATVERLAHARLTSPDLAALLEEAAAQPNPDPEQAAWVRVGLRLHRRAARVPADLVAEMTRAASAGFAVWSVAKGDGDFARFAPSLERLVVLAREYADAVGGPSRYAALLESHEPGMAVSRVESVFAALRKALVPMVAAVAERPAPSRAPFTRPIPTATQLAAGRAAVTAFGYDWSRGRQDLSAHPFSTSFGPQDCRITTRLDVDDFSMAFFSTLHEAGHAMYEQGIPEVWSRTPLGQASSTGVHESQSRLWENMIGRSLPFWEYFTPELERVAPGVFSGLTARELYGAANRVQPSLIRVEADELTYNLHVLLRFELEQGLIAGDLPVGELPAAWNDGMARLIGVRPGNDRQGVLQDVHWSTGAFGYFPTYTLGTVLAAQWLEEAERRIGDLWAEVRAGNFSGLLGFLRGEIHARGASMTPDELATAVSGRPLDVEPYLRYIHRKYEELYGPLP